MTSMRMYEEVRLTGVLALLMIFLALLEAPSAAHATKYDIQVKNYQWKYGTSAYVDVNTGASVAMQKVVGLVTYRSDWAGITEIGHYWTNGNSSSARAFYVWMDAFLARSSDLGPVAVGNTVRYHTGWNPSDGLQYYWKNNEVVAIKLNQPQMTSQWPGVNVERDTPSLYTGDNIGCFSGLKYKNYAWGSWANWDIPEYENKNDNLYKLYAPSPTHVDVIRGY